MVRIAYVEQGTDVACRGVPRIGRRLGRVDDFVEHLRPPPLQLVRRERRIPAQPTALHHEPTHVQTATLDRSADHRDVRPAHLFGQHTHTTEVDEADGAVGVETVVAGVRVGVEQVGVPEVAPPEPKNGLGLAVLDVLIRLLRCRPVHPVEVGHRQNAVRARLRHELRHADEGVPLVQFVESRDHRRLVPVVDLF